MSVTQQIDYVSTPVKSLRGRIRVPGDKSISHRAIMLGAIADGITTINGMLRSADTTATVDVLREMGVRIEEPDGTMVVYGVGKSGLLKPTGPLYFGNSGTSVRLLSGILAAQAFDTELGGDESLMKRPMKRIADPLTMMGAKIRCSDAGTLPMIITGGQSLTGIDYKLPVASAQLKSCLLLAGLHASGTTRLVEPSVTRDHTERMMRQFGAEIHTDGASVTINPGGLVASDVDVPGDISSAAFFMVAAAVIPGSELVLENVGINPTRSAVIDILRLMGADITLESRQPDHAEPVADIHVRASQLKGITIPAEMVPIAIDEFPVIMVAAACAEGETILNNAAELRVKESDRIEAIADGLRQNGIDVQTCADGMKVRGGRMMGGKVDSYGDHRIAMAFAVAAGVAQGPVHITDCVNVDTSFPDFPGIAASAGLNVSVIAARD